MDRISRTHQNRAPRRAHRALIAIAVLTPLALLPASALGGSSGAALSSGSGGAHAAASHTVTISGLSFRPSTLTIKRGDSVTWSWHVKNNEHNVTFHSTHSRTGSSGSLTVRFANAGTFSYICTVHVSKGMRGKVIVK
ncbi:MAG TPA: plastocyanin/azurin family copper-binding protein [Solirubrobacteraceae bacterium]|nr:plastocyanin/azurin family copper-binding protein [Solirubrobacteraceae bacterium]